MDPVSPTVTHDFRPFFRVYNNGRIERFDTPRVSPSTDPNTGVRSKDVVISSEPKVSARLYLPNITTSHHHRIPLLIYFHGGAFSSESAFSTLYHNYLNPLVAATHVIAVSVEYRLAPEHPIPACYDDSWTAFKWIVLHAQDKLGSPDPWINDHADLNRIFLMGDSSGANMAHNLAVRLGAEGIGSGVKLAGMIMIHPLLGNNKPDKFWSYICPGSNGSGDSRFNLDAFPSLMARVACDKVLVCTASKDWLREKNWDYYRALKNSGWKGNVEIVETEDENHVFHLFKVNSEKARSLMKSVATFNNQNHLAHSSL